MVRNVMESEEGRRDAQQSGLRIGKLRDVNWRNRVSKNRLGEFRKQMKDNRERWTYWVLEAAGSGNVCCQR